MKIIEVTNWEKFRLCELHENKRRCSQCLKYWVQIPGYENIKASLKKASVDLEKIVDKNQHYFPVCDCGSKQSESDLNKKEIEIRYDDIMNRVKIPIEYLRFDIDNIPEIIIEKQTGYTLKLYAEEINDNIERRRDLLFYGEADKRKTTTAMIIAHEAAKRGIDVLVCKALDVFNLTICNTEEEYYLKKRYRECKLLIIDELAQTDYEGKQPTLVTIWDDRFSNYKTTIMVTNMSKGTVLDRYEYVDDKRRERPFESRLKRFWAHVYFKGESYRGVENERTRFSKQV